MVDLQDRFAKAKADDPALARSAVLEQRLREPCRTHDAAFSAIQAPLVGRMDVLSVGTTIFPERADICSLA